MKKYFFLLFILFATKSNSQELRLWYDLPAKVWEEALPLGNSRLGAMVFGNPLQEELQLNEDY